MKEKLKIYLSARISQDAHKWNDTICDSLDSRIEIFKPHENNPYSLDHKQFEMAVYEKDLEAMKESDMGLLLAPYGRDCAWEIGWYSNSEKPVVAYVENETDWLRDWMLKGGLSKVITSNSDTYKILRKDPIVGDKTLFIESRSKLSDILFEIYKSRDSKNE